MKVVTWGKDKGWSGRFNGLLKKPSFFVISSFLVYNILLAIVGILLIFAVTSPLWRQNFLNKVYTLSGLAGVADMFRSHPDQPAPYQPAGLKLAIDPASLRALEEARNTALGQGFLAEEGRQAVAGSLQYKDNSYAVELSLDSRLPAPWEATEDPAWFLELKLEPGKTIKGMNRFALRRPGDEDAPGRWLMQQVAKAQGLTVTGYELADLEINGQGKGIYILTEKSSRGNTLPESEPVSAKMFDLPKTAAFFALTDLWGGRPIGSFVQQRFIKNPQSGLLEPVAGSDVPAAGMLSKNKLLASGRLLQLDNAPAAGALSWQEALFSDPEFSVAYIAALEQMVSAPLEEWLPEGLPAKLASRQELLRQRQISYDPQLMATLTENAHYISQTLYPRKRIHAYFRAYVPERRELEIDVVNIHHLPAEILKASIGDSTELRLSSASGMINACAAYQPAPVQTLRFQVPEAVNWGDSLLSGLKVYAVTPGSARSLGEEVTPYTASDQQFLASDLLRGKPNAGEFPFLQIDERQKKIIIKPGDHHLDRDLIFPAGYEVIAGEGVRINITGGANIVSYSAFNLRGSREKPVVFYSSDSTAQGVSVMQPKKESVLRFVEFDNLANPNRGGWVLTSAINFYEAPVRLIQVTFKHNRIGDDALNIIRSNFEMDSVLFEGTNADAFDSDFSNGTIRNTRFYNCGNDGLDISGSQIQVENLDIRRAGDKGVSVGEKSYLTGKNIRILGAEIGFTAKDLSQVEASDVHIQDSKIGYCAFQKKPEYGPAVIRIEKGSSISGKGTINYLIEDGCHRPPATRSSAGRRSGRGSES